MHVHGQGGVLRDEEPRGAGVIEVDVREEDRVEVGDGESSLRDLGPERLERGARAGVEEERAAVRVEQLYGHALGAAKVADLDRGVGRGHEKA